MKSMGSDIIKKALMLCLISALVTASFIVGMLFGYAKYILAPFFVMLFGIIGLGLGIGFLGMFILIGMDGLKGDKKC